MTSQFRRSIGAMLLAAAPAWAFAQGEPVKIGFMATLSGPAAALGQDMYDGFMLGIENAGGKLGGATVEVIKEDDQLKPDLAVQTVNRFIERDQVDIVGGITFSNVMMAIAKPLADSETIFVGMNAGPAPLAGERCDPNFFFASYQNDQQAEGVGKYATDKGYKNVYVMAPNYQAGRDAVGGFKRFFKGNIVGEVYTRVNQPDYSAEIAQLQAAAPDAVYVFYPGGMGINFIKQFRQAGLLGQIPLMSVSSFDGSTLPALQETAIGAISGSFWGPDFDNAANKKFVADFEAKYGRIPSQYAAQAYDAAMLLDSALAKTDGNAKDKAALKAALREADFESVRGNFKFNKNGFPVLDMYVFEVAKDDKGRVSHKTLQETLPGHSDSYLKECPL
ncbi:ABC transporter substrate-binding protein [Orrella marina]|uniref:ABC transporter substrate-binding protein n=1 Tax=Orrella marina TaxID=2163011 RepID=A0A2R4XKF7_9BURK|nr:ABC transporter substrate-binding protein [Orrella marina]AWB34199.1 ABC transporter substrate-binding protein [Orrella marina]